MDVCVAATAWLTVGGLWKSMILAWLPSDLHHPMTYRPMTLPWRSCGWHQNCSGWAPSVLWRAPRRETCTPLALCCRKSSTEVLHISWKTLHLRVSMECKAHRRPAILPRWPLPQTFVEFSVPSSLQFKIHANYIHSWILRGVSIFRNHWPCDEGWIWALSS